MTWNWSHSSEGRRVLVMFLWKINASIGATLRLSHTNSSNTVVKCSFTSSIRRMTRNKFHLLDQFFTSFFHLAVSGALLLYMTCFLHNSQCTPYCSAICWCSFKNLHNRLQHMYEATWTLPTDKCLLLIFLRYIKVIYFRTSPSSILSSSSSYLSENNSSLSSGVKLFVSDSSPSNSAMSSSLLLFALKAETTSLPLSVKTINNLLHDISHSACNHPLK